MSKKVALRIVANNDCDINYKYITNILGYPPC